MAQPEVEAQETVVAPANGGERQRTVTEVSQPPALSRPLKETARLENERTADTVLGQDYTVSKDRGYRKA